MRFRVRTLLIVLVVTLAALPGCSEYSRVKQVQRGAEGIDQHAHEIKDAANAPP
jgi:hypothetical protein